MPTKRAVLEILKRDELLDAIDRFELEVADRRIRDLSIEALASSRSPARQDPRQFLPRSLERDLPIPGLIATDAAREGVNLQNHCADLFHFDVPWNPSRMEQRNGRIDRKLQRAERVRCHYYVFPQRAEDRVLDVLAAKTARIHRELGSLSPVVERRLDRLLADGIRHEREPDLTDSIENVDREAGSLLEDALASPRLRDVPEAVVRRLRTSAAQDVAELKDQLEKRADVLAERAARGEKEAEDMRAILEAQRDRIAHRRRQVEDEERQLKLDFQGDERRQLEADKRHWTSRLDSLDRELVDEPERVRSTYEVKARRVEPAGWAYLWPVSR